MCEKTVFPNRIEVSLVLARFLPAFIKKCSLNSRFKNHDFLVFLIPYQGEDRDENASHVSRSPRRSRLRTGVAMYLYKIYPEASYPADIARNIEIEPTNVLGGLQDMGNRFDKSNPLIGLGLVDEISVNDATYYRLSERGKSLIENLNLVVPVVK